MRKYFILNSHNQLKYIGKFEDFPSAWDYLNYSTNENFVWLMSDRRLEQLIKDGISLLNYFSEDQNK